MYSNLHQMSYYHSGRASLLLWLLPLSSEDKIENEFSYNFQEYGDKILDGATATNETDGSDISSLNETDRKAAIINHIKESFATGTIEKFPEITKEAIAITFAISKFIADTSKKGGVTQTKLDSYRKDMFKQMEAKSKDMLNGFVNEACL